MYQQCQSYALEIFGMSFLISIITTNEKDILLLKKNLFISNYHEINTY